MCDVSIYLWKSQQCGSDSSCFFKVLLSTTVDIIVRVGRDESSDKEDVALT